MKRQPGRREGRKEESSSAAAPVTEAGSRYEGGEVKCAVATLVPGRGKVQQTCAEGKVGGVEWQEKVVSEVASWNDGREEEEVGSILCIPKIWLS